MIVKNFQIEPSTPFSESLIWQLNRDFYNEKGIGAWSHGVVPHYMTSNSMVGKTYAELILGFLKDLGKNGKTSEVVYILELGAGHGRLAFHLLKHLEELVDLAAEKLPPYCYVLSDIVSDNLTFFHDHDQFQDYLQKGILDIAFFDAINSKELVLQYSKKTIQPKSLSQPILAIANYFFDSIPNDLFFIKDKTIASCEVSIDSKEDPAGMETDVLIKHMELSYQHKIVETPIYEDALLNELIEDYKTLATDTYVFFPKNAMGCMKNIEALSSAGLLLLSMDKGYHQKDELENRKEPDVIRHGSLSLWVNFHALSSYCKKNNGQVMFPSFSNFHLELGCLLFLKDKNSYAHLDAAYKQHVNNFGPDDFNSIKQMAYTNVSKLALKELIALYRLSAYDSTFFIKLLPRLKQVIGSISFKERRRISETLDSVWNMYFYINEDYDLAYEIGGMFYDLGFYKEALQYFGHSIQLFGKKADLYYNEALCYYQLREEKLFYKTWDEGKLAFPDFKRFENFEKLDMS